MTLGKNTANSRSIVWVRCNDPAKIPVILSLDEELQNDGNSVWLELTLPNAKGEGLAHPTGQRSVKAFVHNLKPDAVLWVGGQLDPTTLTICHSRDIPVVVADAGIAMLPRMARGWFPGKTRALLSQLSKVFARTDDAAAGLLRAGVREDAIEVTGPLEETGRVLTWDEDTRYALAQKIGPRPIWFASCIDESEAKHVAVAQKEASLRAHRLLCIISTEDDVQKIASYFRQQNLNVSFETEGDNLDESTQIFIVDGSENHGLWTRLAPITYIGGSQSTGARIDPFHVATVGSVVVHGPQKGNYPIHFDRLINAEATVVIGHYNELGPAIAHLLSAEKAAKYAQAGWEVTSSGAEVVNTIATSLGNLFDGKGRAE